VSKQRFRWDRRVTNCTQSPRHQVVTRSRPPGPLIPIRDRLFQSINSRRYAPCRRTIITIRARIPILLSIYDFLSHCAAHKNRLSVPRFLRKSQTPTRAVPKSTTHKWLFGRPPLQEEGRRPTAISVLIRDCVTCPLRKFVIRVNSSEGGGKKRDGARRGGTFCRRRPSSN
jgi:hypothetical protein